MDAFVCRYLQSLKKTVKESEKNISDTGLGMASVLERAKQEGTLDEWLRAYEYFCNQTVNTKGQKVNRQRLKDYKVRYGKGE